MKTLSESKCSLLTLEGKRIWVTGHKGMLGSALVRTLKPHNAELLLADRQELDLTNKSDVRYWMEKNKPEFVFHAAAKVGGIYANATFPADFLQNNLAIQASVIDGAYQCGVKKLIFVASNCTYPAETSSPILENALMTGKLEENIRFYAMAKIAGIEMCRAYNKQYGCDFISVIPPNLYGIGDNYHPQNAHVVAGIIRRAHEAKNSQHKELVVWGDGTQRRELLYVDDLAEAMKWLMCSSTPEDLYNIGCGHDLSVAEIAKYIVEVIGFEGEIVFDKSKPNGTMRKLLDSSRIRTLGWTPKVNEKEGLKNAYNDFLTREIG
jgi:GDP-L-fucose synthase